MQYIQLFSAALWLSVSPNSFYENVIRATPSDGFESFYTELIAAQLIGAGLIFVAVAQFESEGAQRKVLQYSFGGYFLLGATQYIHNKDNGLVVIAFCAVNVVTVLAAIYGFHKEKKLFVEKEDRDSGPLKLSLRILYVLFVFITLVHYFDLLPGATARAIKNSTGFGRNLHFTRIMESVRSISAGALIGAAQLSNKDMKKTVQYLLALPILSIIVLVINVDYFTDDSANFAFTMHTLLFILFSYACYPASCAKTTIRLCYFCLFGKSCFALIKTRRFLTTRMSFLSEANSSEPMGKIIGLQYAAVALLFICAAQGSAETHRKFLQYTLAGNIVKMFGMHFLLKVVDTEGLFGSLLLILVLYNKTIGLDKLFEMLGCKSLGDSSEKSSPARSTPKRSSTPASRKKKSK